jgi:hypothetical protein
MRVRWLAVALVTAFLCAVPAAAQAARPLDHVHYEFAASFTEEDCGLTIDFDFSISGLATLREVKGSEGQAYLGTDNFRFRQVMTNTDTGAWMVVRGNGMSKELRATQIEGDIWEFTAMDVGQFVIENSDGEVVLKDRGQISYRFVFDTLGDGQPGGDVLEEEITGVHGPHPSLDVDFCTVVNDLIG